MQFTSYVAVYDFDANVWKKRDPDFPIGEDTFINLANTEGKKQENV